MLLAAGFFWYVAPEIARDELGSVVAARFSWVAETSHRVALLLRDPMTTTTTAFGRDVYADAPRPAPQRARPMRQVIGGTITKTS